MQRTIKKPLTKSQKRYFEYIKSFIKENGVSPSPEEVSKFRGTGLANASRYIDALCKKGWIKKDNSKRPPVLELL